VEPCVDHPVDRVRAAAADADDLDDREVTAALFSHGSKGEGLKFDFRVGVLERP
jgi:hypothetical protein